MQGDKKKASAAHMRATAKYESKAYDKALIRFPRGTQERIRATGKSVNGFTVKAVLDLLDILERRHDDTTT